MKLWTGWRCSFVSEWMDSGYGSYFDALFVELPSLPQGRWVLTQGFLPDGALQTMLTIAIGRSCNPVKYLFCGPEQNRIRAVVKLNTGGAWVGLSQYIHSLRSRRIHCFPGFPGACLRVSERRECSVHECLESGGQSTPKKALNCIGRLLSAR